ncbi:MAG: hypothetical protein AAFU79_35580, partial [Myxococcota bacterium]
ASQPSTGSGLARAELAPAPVGRPATAQGAAQDSAFLSIDAQLVSMVGGTTGPNVTAGTEVRRLASHDGWTLVLVEPSGPVGFVEADRLTRQKPIQAMARDFAFTGCVAPELPCLSSAREQRDRCVDACGPLGSRCETACRIAFEQCQRDCRR